MKIEEFLKCFDFSQEQAEHYRQLASSDETTEEVLFIEINDSEQENPGIPHRQNLIPLEFRNGEVFANIHGEIIEPMKAVEKVWLGTMIPKNWRQKQFNNQLIS